MRTIAQIVKDIKGELHGAKHYAELANKHKDEDDSLSEMYASMSNQELGHVNTMHAQVVRIINDYRRKHGEPPEAMKAIWDWEHQQMVEEVAEVKRLLEIVRG